MRQEQDLITNSPKSKRNLEENTAAWTNEGKRITRLFGKRFLIETAVMDVRGINYLYELSE